ncbi:MAG TPA: gamma-glutamyl-gamma-aminobutyrate hydrolase family protein [Actinomycetota bacterium]|jgi:gamma-glutamyl-gamma-aminobutyrate hydrolase PuuD|nr:gamma-glutamyl-gamma-aminobutyrate hydrolase family protein [Actinomycetota bacterium]
MRPRIALTTSPATVDHTAVELVNRSYIDAVVRAGGIPFVLPVLDRGDAEAALAVADGLLLTGGGDVEPARYGASPGPKDFGIDHGRDAFEVALVLAALRVGLPILGICRGCQVLNVALGGSLVQHIPAVTGRDHCRKGRECEKVHEVDITPGSLLASVVGAIDIDVNSLHHQAVDRVGVGLQAVGWSDDGVVEGIEAVIPARLIGVQWHPELLRGDPVHERFFDWLVTEAARPLTASRDQLSDVA